MSDLRPAPLTPLPGPADRGSDRAWKVAGGFVLVLLLALGVGLVGLVVLAQQGRLGAGATPVPSGATFAVDPRDAPPLALVDQDGQPFSLDRMRGEPTLVFFGYTHCPDVCPATVGILNQALEAVGDGPHAVFVSIDPERDDPASLKSYLKYLPKAYTAVTGTPAQVRAAADAWGVSYAKVDEGSAAGYSMSHTASVYLLDAGLRIRSVFPFGTESAPIAEAVAALRAETAAATPTPVPATATPGPTATPAPTPGGTATPGPGATPMAPVVVSSSVFAGGQSPVILELFDAAGSPIRSAGIAARATLASLDRSFTGPEVQAVIVRPEGVEQVYAVVTLDIPSPGPWTLNLTATDGPVVYAGSAGLRVLDPAGTAPIGQKAPDIRTPTLSSVGGLALAVTTAPVPDLRLSETSTVDATAAGRPYVLLVDSYTFKVSPACGRALVMARFLPDRWTDVTFIHLEPFEYTIAGTSPVITGSLQAPVLNEYARAWGLGTGLYTPLDVPWIFIVDKDGIVRAKSTNVVGSPDVDVILAMLEMEG